MTPAQQSALESLVGRPLTGDEYMAIDALLPIRNDVEIAAVLSAGRVRLVSHMVSERGVRNLLGAKEAMEFLNTLRDLDGATVLPDWLEAGMVSAHIPADEHAATLDAMACAWAWLRSDGIDLGSARTQDLLDLLSISKPAIATACQKLKQAGRADDPIDYNSVSNALNDEDEKCRTAAQM